MTFWKARFSVAAIALWAATMPVDATHAGDLDTQQVKAKPITNVPFFFINDNRLTYAYAPTAASPGSANRTAKQTVGFTHFDEWAYGTNFANLVLIKSDHADPASPCPILQVSGCAGMTEFFGTIRSTFGFNQIFNTKAFSAGPLRNVSLEVGADGQTTNQFAAPSKRVLVGGLQFAFDLPYRGFFNVAPMLYKEWGHNAFYAPAFVAPLAPGVVDGSVDYNPTWVIETNYYMDLGFLPETLQYFSVSGRASLIGPKGSGAPSNLVPTSRNPPTAIELYSEPIRLTFDASKALWGPKYSHFFDVWVAYRYWQNKFGLDHNVSPVCTAAATNRSCTESTLYSGITMKF